MGSRSVTRGGKARSGSRISRGRLPDRVPHGSVSGRARGSRHRPTFSWVLGALGLVAGLALGLLVPPLLAGAGDSTQDRIAELEAADRERDAALTRDLVTTAEQTRDEIMPVLTALRAALPPLDAPTAGPSAASAPAAATTADVAGWRSAVDAAAGRFVSRPSGGTEVNLARSGLAGAVATLRRAVEAYDLSLQVPSPDRLRTLAAQLRDDAVVAWSVAATQLDVAGIKANLGHVHVFLSSQGVDGEMTSDHAEEGPH